MRIFLYRYGAVLGALAAIVAVLVAILVAGCTSGSYGQAPTLVPAPSGSLPSGSSPSAEIPGLPAAPAPVKTHDPRQVTGTLNGPCHIRHYRGQVLPDRSCTPGAYDPAITAAILCAPGYSTSSYRPPSSQTTKFKYSVAEPAYGQDHVSGELDHLISLELGGANDAANLWVEPGPIPNSKDQIESALHDWVCSARAEQAAERLAAAQRAIAANWVTARERLGA